jgi:hypothetical protein
MNIHKLLTVVLLILPGTSWGPPEVPVDEPSVLPLLAIGGVIAVAMSFVRRKK